MLAFLECFQETLMPRTGFCLLFLLFCLAGCTALLGRDPLNVTLVGIEPLPGEGMEVRMAVKLRVQNPNDVPVTYDGVAINLELRGNDIASGVSDAKGSVPRFGETVLVVPVTVSAMAMLKQAFSFATSANTKLDFVVRGKLSGSGLGGMRFESRGEVDVPAGSEGS
jgi:LEA14-like dessication related protein